MIRYDAEYNRNIERIVSNFNRKVARLQKTGRSVLPSKVSIRELKAQNLTRGEMNRQLRELQRFSRRGAEKIVTVDGKQYTAYDIDVFRRRLRSERQRLTKDIQKAQSYKSKYPMQHDIYTTSLKTRRATLSQDWTELISSKVGERLMTEPGRNAELYDNYLEILFQDAYQVGFEDEKINYIKERQMIMGRIIAVANQKGGVGKTTTSTNLSACLAELNKRVLLIDIDPQGNATSGVGVDKNQLDNTVYEMIIGECEMEDCLLENVIDNLDLLPSNVNLAGAEIDLIGVEAREFILKKQIDEIKDNYDFIIIDCPPSLNMLTVNAMTTADSVLVPIQCEYYALEGLSQLIHTINLVKERLNPTLEIEGVVFTMYDARTNLSLQVVENVKNNLDQKIYETIIPRNVRLAEAPSYGLPIILYDNRSAGAESYRALAKEVIRLVEQPNEFQHSYELEGSIEDKLNQIVQKIYGGKRVVLTANAQKQAKELEALGYGNAPICMAKTQYSLTDDQTKLGAPTDFEVTVRNLKISAGAGFIVALTGEIMTMPGLPKVPAAERIDIDNNGKITGLF